MIEAVFEDRKVKSDVIAKIQAVIGPDTVFASNTSTLPITSLADRVQGPAALHRHPFLLAGRRNDAGRDHPRQGNRRQGARRRARLRARDPQDADRGERLARLLRQPLRAQLHPGRPSDAAGRHSGGDDREHRAHGRHAGRPARRSTTRPRSTSACKIVRAAEADLGQERHQPGAEEAPGGHGREERPPRPQERQGLLRLSARPAEAPVAGPRRSAAEETHAANKSRRSTSRSSSSASW